MSDTGMEHYRSEDNGNSDTTPVVVASVGSEFHISQTKRFSNIIVVAQIHKFTILHVGKLFSEAIEPMPDGSDTKMWLEWNG